MASGPAGTVNRGWDVAKYLLQHERAMISGMGERGVGRPLGQIAADSVGADAQGRLDDAQLRSQIANFEVDEAALAAAAERTAKGVEGLRQDVRNNKAAFG